jgi:AhpD family alkylhydroperoxidase
MNQRIQFDKASPGLMQAMYGLEKYLRHCGLETGLLDLVRLRASQINGCAYCVDMHSKDLRAAGESNERLDSLVTWRESPYYTDRERAALAWTEAVTLISNDHVPDDIYAWARQQFDEGELVNLTAAVAAINAWNRFAISFRVPPGTYKAGQQATVTA